MRKGKDGLARNQDNVSEWGEMSIDPKAVVSVVQYYQNRTKGVSLAQSGPHHQLIEN